MSLFSLNNSIARLCAASAAFLSPIAAIAQDAAEETVTSAVDSGDTAWMLMSTVLVLFMILPGLALFYGGLVRSKNMLSVLIQCVVVSSVVMVIWVFYGYSLAFSNGGSLNAFIGGFEKLFLSGVTPESESGSIPEFVFIAFQMTFACITPALIVGAFAERIRFSAVVLFSALWVTFVYFPMAHMVWSGDGALIWDWGALDFAGGTVVHINAGIAGLVGSILVGKRTGLGKDMMAPHSMTLTMVGASMLWVGWFGFNAGSAAAANGTAGLAMINTFTATAGAVISWCLIECFARGKTSMLGAASGVVAGLVAVTPAAGAVGPIGAIVLGAIASAFCYFFVAVVKNKFGYDDTADVFGVHGIGGIVGAIGTGVFAASSLGGIGYAEGMSMGTQVWVQIKSVIVTLVSCGVGSFILYKIVDVTVGLRVSADAERQGLDLASHGEAAYHS